MYYKDQKNISRNKQFTMVDSFLTNQKSQQHLIQKLPQNLNQMQQPQETFINNFQHPLQSTTIPPAIQMNKVKSNGQDSLQFLTQNIGTYSGQLMNQQDLHLQNIKEDYSNHLHHEIFYQPYAQKQTNKQMAVEVFNQKQFSTQQLALQEQHQNTQQVKHNMIQKSGLNHTAQIKNKFSNYSIIQNTSNGGQDNKSQIIQKAHNKYTIAHQQNNNQELLTSENQIPNKRGQFNSHNKQILGMDYQEQQKTIQPILNTNSQQSTVFFMPYSSQLTQYGTQTQQSQQQLSSQQNQIKKHQRHYSEISTQRDTMQYLQPDNKLIIPSSSNQIPVINFQNKENLNIQMKVISQHQYVNQLETDANIKNNYYDIKTPAISDPFEKINKKKLMSKHQNDSNLAQINQNQNKDKQYFEDPVDKCEVNKQFKIEQSNTQQSLQNRSIGYAYQNTLPNKEGANNQQHFSQKHQRQSSLNIQPSHYQFLANGIDKESLLAKVEDTYSISQNDKNNFNTHKKQESLQTKKDLYSNPNKEKINTYENLKSIDAQTCNEKISQNIDQIDNSNQTSQRGSVKNSNFQKFQILAQDSSKAYNNLHRRVSTMISDVPINQLNLIENMSHQNSNRSIYDNKELNAYLFNSNNSKQTSFHKNDSFQIHKSPSKLSNIYKNNLPKKQTDIEYAKIEQTNIQNQQQQSITIDIINKPKLILNFDSNITSPHISQTNSELKNKQIDLNSQGQSISSHASYRDYELSLLNDQNLKKQNEQRKKSQSISYNILNQKTENLKLEPMNSKFQDYEHQISPLGGNISQMTRTQLNTNSILSKEDSHNNSQNILIGIQTNNVSLNQNNFDHINSNSKSTNISQYNSESKIQNPNPCQSTNNTINYTYDSNNNLSNISEILKSGRNKETSVLQTKTFNFTFAEQLKLEKQKKLNDNANSGLTSDRNINNNIQSNISTNINNKNSNNNSHKTSNLCTPYISEQNNIITNIISNENNSFLYSNPPSLQNMNSEKTNSSYLSSAKVNDILLNPNSSRRISPIICSKQKQDSTLDDINAIKSILSQNILPSQKDKKYYTLQHNNQYKLDQDNLPQNHNRNQTSKLIINHQTQFQQNQFLNKDKANNNSLIENNITSQESNKQNLNKLKQTAKPCINTLKPSLIFEIQSEPNSVKEQLQCDEINSMTDRYINSQNQKQITNQINQIQYGHTFPNIINNIDKHNPEQDGNNQACIAKILNQQIQTSQKSSSYVQQQNQFQENKITILNNINLTNDFDDKQKEKTQYQQQKSDLSYVKNFNLQNDQKNQNQQLFQQQNIQEKEQNQQKQHQKWQPYDSQARFKDQEQKTQQKRRQQSTINLKSEINDILTNQPLNSNIQLLPQINPNLDESIEIQQPFHHSDSSSLKQISMQREESTKLLMNYQQKTNSNQKQQPAQKYNIQTKESNQNNQYQQQLLKNLQENNEVNIYKPFYENQTNQTQQLENDLQNKPIQFFNFDIKDSYLMDFEDLAEYFNTNNITKPSNNNSPNIKEQVQLKTNEQQIKINPLNNIQQLSKTFSLQDTSKPYMKIENHEQISEKNNGSAVYQKNQELNSSYNQNEFSSQSNELKNKNIVNQNNNNSWQDLCQNSKCDNYLKKDEKQIKNSSQKYLNNQNDDNYKELFNQFDVNNDLVETLVNLQNIDFHQEEEQNLDNIQLLCEENDIQDEDLNYPISKNNNIDQNILNEESQINFKNDNLKAQSKITSLKKQEFDQCETYNYNQNQLIAPFNDLTSISTQQYNNNTNQLQKEKIIYSEPKNISKKETNISKLTKRNKENQLNKINQQDESNQHDILQYQYDQNINQQSHSKKKQQQKQKLQKELEDFDQNQYQIFGGENLNYLLSREEDYRPNPYYMKSQQHFSPLMRAILIDWMMEVSEEFKLKRETFYIALNIIERIFSIKTNLGTKDFQLIGVTSLYIASKLEEVFPPKIEHFILSTDNGYDIQTINQQEKDILMTLKFMINPPTPSFWGNWFMSQWDIFISTSEKAQNNQLVLKYYNDNSNLIQFKQAHNKSYDIFREYMQIIDFTYLNLDTLQIRSTLLHCSVMYIVLGKAFEIFDKQNILNDLANGVINDPKFALFNKLFNAFSNISFDMEIDEIVYIIQYVSNFFILPISNIMPIAPSDEKHQKYGNYEDFLQHQTHNKDQIKIFKILNQ